MSPYINVHPVDFFGGEIGFVFLNLKWSKSKLTLNMTKAELQDNKGKHKNIIFDIWPTLIFPQRQETDGSVVHI